MTFTPSDEQEQLRATVRGFLAQASPMTEVRRLMSEPAGFDEAVWTEICKQLQLVGLAVPEVYGGSGYSARELAIVFEEAGATLLCAPLLSNAAMVPSLILATHDVARRHRDISRPSATERSARPWPCARATVSSWSRSMRTVAEKDGSAHRLHRAQDVRGRRGNRPSPPGGRPHLRRRRRLRGRSRCRRGQSAAHGDDGRDPQAGRRRARSRARRARGTPGSGWRSVVAMLDFTAAILAAEQVGGARSDAWTWRSDYAKSGCSSAGRSDRSRPSSTSAPTCSSTSSRPARRRSTRASAAGERPRRARRCAASLASSFCSEAYVTTRPRRTSRCTAASGSPGSTTRTSTSSGPSARVACLGGPAFHREKLVTHLGI